MFGSAMFLFVCSVNRIRKLSTNSTMNDLIQVQWSEIIGWHLLEGLFFYGTGHQPTFPTIQWSAAFNGGFSGAEYGSSETNVVFGYVLPALLIGWNTYISRIWFGLFLPMLLIAPIAIWLVSSSTWWLPSLRPKTMDSTSKRTTDIEVNASSSYHDDSLTPNANLSKELGKGEVFFLENIHQTRSQVFNLCIRYCILQSLRVFSTMLAAAIHRRHLMVWKIFAPRFIFEGIGCVVSFVFVTFGYMLFVRIQNCVSNYYQKLQSCDKDK
jgi:phosphatidylinositol glycan class O